MTEKSNVNKDVELDTWYNWKINRDPFAGNELITKYLTLVDYVVHRLAISLPHSISKDDLKSFGFNGLLDAIEKFDLERGLQFETYASWRIKGAIIDGLRQNDWIPRSVRDKARKIEEAYAKLEQKYLRSVTDEEVCSYLEIEQEELNKVISEASLSFFTSIDEPIYDEEEHQIGRYNMIKNVNAESPEETIHQQFIKERLIQVIDQLPEKEKIVVSLFYYEELNLTEIAEMLKLSTSRISQLHSKAILRLKSVMQRDKEYMTRL